MPPSDAPQSGDQRRKRPLTQNREMKTISAWNWSLPAWAGRLADGRTYNTYPSAGICRHVCYALNGTYRWPVVRARHHANCRVHGNVAVPGLTLRLILRGPALPCRSVKDDAVRPLWTAEHVLGPFHHVFDPVGAC
jgi:hypothetical protein